MRQSLERYGRHLIGEEFKRNYVGDSYEEAVAQGKNFRAVLTLPFDDIKDLGASMATPEEAYRKGRNRVLAYIGALAAVTAITAESAGHTDFVSQSAPVETVVEHSDMIITNDMAQPQATNVPSLQAPVQ